MCLHALQPNSEDDGEKQQAPNVPVPHGSIPVMGFVLQLEEPFQNPTNEHSDINITEHVDIPVCVLGIQQAPDISIGEPHSTPHPIEHLPCQTPPSLAHVISVEEV